MGRADRKAIIEKIQTQRNSTVICYLTSDRPQASAMMEKDVIPLFYEHLRRAGTISRVDVFLFTSGGDTLAAFGLSRLLREFTCDVSTLIPDKCHSAGTLFALGSSTIAMTRLATLSPIDPSVNGPLNPAIELAPGQRQLVPLSVESVAGFKSLATEDWGVKTDEGIFGSLKLLADRVHPLALGDVYRRRQQIESLAHKLLSSHRADEERIRHVITVLTKNLGSHDYLISRREAKELLGDQVAPDDPALEDMLWDLYKDFATEMQLGQAYDAHIAVQAAKVNGIQLPCTLVQQLAVVESLSLRHLCRKEVRANEIQVPSAGGLQRGTLQEPTASGWIVEA